MTTSQENKLTMYQMVERYLLDRAAVVSALPNYTASSTLYGRFNVPNIAARRLPAVIRGR